MKMQITCPDFDMRLFDSMQEACNKYAKTDCVCGRQGDGGTTVWISCEADMVKCMEVIAMIDLYYLKGGESDDIPDLQQENQQ